MKSKSRHELMEVDGMKDEVIWVLHCKDYKGNIYDTVVSHDLQKLSLLMLSYAADEVEMVEKYEDFNMETDYLDDMKHTAVGVEITACDGNIWYQFNIEEAVVLENM